MGRGEGGKEPPGRGGSGGRGLGLHARDLVRPTAGFLRVADRPACPRRGPRGVGHAAPGLPGRGSRAPGRVLGASEGLGAGLGSRAPRRTPAAPCRCWATWADPEVAAPRFRRAPRPPPAALRLRGVAPPRCPGPARGGPRSAVPAGYRPWPILGGTGVRRRRVGFRGFPRRGLGEGGAAAKQGPE